MNNYYVYMVRCADGTLYTGITNEIERRMDEHNGKGAAANVGAKYTRTRRPVELVFSQSCSDRSAASQEEYRIKQLTKQQKQDLINSSANECLID